MTGETFLGRLDAESGISQRQLALAGLAVFAATALALELTRSGAPAPEALANGAWTSSAGFVGAASVPAGGRGAMDSMASLSEPARNAAPAALPEADEKDLAAGEEVRDSAAAPALALTLRERPAGGRASSSAFEAARSPKAVSGIEGESAVAAPSRRLLSPRSYQPLARSFRPFRGGRAGNGSVAAAVETADARTGQVGRMSDDSLAMPDDAVDSVADLAAAVGGAPSVTQGRAPAAKAQPARCTALERSCGANFAASCADIKRVGGRGVEERAGLGTVLARLGAKVESCETRAQSLGCSDVPSLARVRADVAGYCGRAAR